MTLELRGFKGPSRCELKVCWPGRPLPTPDLDQLLLNTVLSSKSEMIDYKLNIVLRFCVRFHQEYTVQIKNTDIERDKDRPDILYKNRDP